jgi:V/A-type H+-transporting ATPase subunit K
MDKLFKILALFLILVLTFGVSAAQEHEEAAATVSDSSWKIAVAAAFASAYGIAHAGSAAMAAMAEKPEVATWGVIIVALAEGLALYGLVIAFMIIGKI